MGASVSAPRQSNSTYAQTVIWSIYETIWTKHPHSKILCYKICPQEPTSFALLHVIFPGYVLIYATPMSTSTVVRNHGHREHSVTASIASPLCRQLSDASSFINIGSSALTAVDYLIIFKVFYLILLTLFDWIQPTVFDWVWLSFSPIRFNSNLTHFSPDSSHIIWVLFGKDSESPILTRVSSK